ncbi:MAG: cold shock domain-containing protein [Pseudomonadota bacterium]
MDTKIFQGRLERWNDERGFGFIRVEANARDVFVHISAFKKNTSRRPRLDDIVLYEIHTEKDGKMQAVNAQIKGLSSAKTSRKSRKPGLRKSPRPSHNTSITKGISIVFILVMGVFLYKNYALESSRSNAVESTPKPVKQVKQVKTEYSCQGKVYCSEMRSCEEAMFYQRNCPATKMDGDHDGVPCERQWCGR